MNEHLLHDAVESATGEKITKKKLVLEHLQTHGVLSSWEAIDKYGETRLAAKIFELRKKYDIESEDKEGIDRYGNLSHYVDYYYHGELPEEQKRSTGSKKYKKKLCAEIKDAISYVLMNRVTGIYVEPRYSTEDVIELVNKIVDAVCDGTFSKGDK